MVSDIGDLHVKGREWKVGKRRSRCLLLKDVIGRGGKQEGRGREVREKKGGSSQQIVPHPWSVSINVVNSKAKNLNSKAGPWSLKSFRLPCQVQRLVVSVVHVAERVSHCTVHTDHLNYH